MSFSREFSCGNVLCFPFPLSPGKKLHRVRLCPKPPGYHPADSGPAQPAPAGHRQNLPE